MLDAENPLSVPSTLPYGLPPFAAVRLEHLRPALEEGMAAELEQWRQIATNTQPPSVENTVVAVDDAGGLFDRAATVFGALHASVGGPELDALMEEMAPTFAQHADAFWMNPDMYARYVALAQDPGLDAETAWVVRQTVADFERSGVNLPPEKQKRVRDLNHQIAQLAARFDTRISRQLSEVGLSGDDSAQLVGLSRQQIERAQQRAADKGAPEGWWFLPIQNFTSPDALAHLEDPQTRADLLRVSEGRGLAEPPDLDTRELVVELARARAERAALLGYPSHAHLVMDEETVPGPQAAKELLGRLASAAVAGMDRERAQLSAVGAPAKLTAADWPYWERHLREQLLGTDMEQLRSYFPLSRVIEDGVFFAAEKLYGLQFISRPELRGATDDARVWEVLETDGKPVGLFVADYYARPGKSGGAWMDTWVPACGRTGERPVVVNEANFHREADGGEPLLNWDQVETCFHEFGHALHGLLTATKYRATEGANVPRDFVELPSQLNEMWAYHPVVLQRMGRHVETGEPLDENTITSLAQSRTVLQSYASLEQAAAALLDQAWHSFGSAEEVDEDVAGDVEGFERRALERVGASHALVPPRYHSAYFAHVFTVGYDAAFYSYTWSEAMAAELEQWFRGGAAGDGGLNREAGETLRRAILSRGNSRDPLEGFVEIVGHTPAPEAIIARRGL